jgi:hypothetical protein
VVDVRNNLLTMRHCLTNWRKRRVDWEFGMFMFSSISNHPQNCTAKIDPDATADATAERETQEKKEVV